VGKTDVDAIEPSAAERRTLNLGVVVSFKGQMPIPDPDGDTAFDSARWGTRMLIEGTCKPTSVDCDTLYPMSNERCTISDFQVIKKERQDTHLSHTLVHTTNDLDP